MKYVCIWCGNEFESYPSTQRKFCSSACSYRHKSKRYNPSGYRRRPDLTELNKKLNPTRMNDDTKAKLCLSHFGVGSGKTYRKLNGRHLHRIIAERIIGRELLDGEVVHHIDGDKSNNSPENIVVFSSQSEHAKVHFKERPLR